MKNVALKPVLFLLMLVVFTFHMISVIPAFAAETISSSSASESAFSTSTSEVESNSPALPTETLENTPSLDTENNDPTPKPNPDTIPKAETAPVSDTILKAETNSSKAPEKDIYTFESALSSEDVIAIRSDLYAIRNLMEEFIYIILPLCAALLIVFILCYWFYCTFIKSAL